MPARTFLAVAFTGALFAAAPALRAQDPRAEARAAILSLQARIDSALVANDADALAPLLTSDATRTGPTGVLTTREQWLAQIRQGGIRYTAVRREQTDVRLYGDVGVVTGIVAIDVVKPGTGAQAERNRTLRVYVKEAGMWRLAAHQATAIAP
jgi:uncharacterized protein (TIGR02246 family)